MLLFFPKGEDAAPAGSRSGPLMELEQRMTEFLAHKSHEAEIEVLELVRLHRDEIRRQRMREFRRNETV